MKLTSTLLPFAALTSAFVIPDEQLTRQLVAESDPSSSNSFFSKLAHKTSDAIHDVEDAVYSALDGAFAAADTVKSYAEESYEDVAANGWLESADSLRDSLEDSVLGKHGHHDHHGHHGHHDDKHHQRNRTIYQLISECKYTTTLTSLINEYDDLVDVLNGTAANYTLFAPSDEAFEKAMKHHKKPSKEEIKMILAYHLSAEFYPAGRVLASHTIPSTYGEPHLNGRRQRLRVRLGLNGLTLNFYSRIIAANVFGTNGVIHGIDHVLQPPPPSAEIITLFPAWFSTLRLALEKTDLLDKVAAEHHHGGTIFAPSNLAFAKLGPKINMFLFSEHGKKYLKALIQYHIVPEQTLYSDAFYPTKKGHDDANSEGYGDIPKGQFQVDLDTLLDGHKLNVDIVRFGGVIVMKLNGFVMVATQDGIAQDGVLHELNHVLMPPKTPGGVAEVVTEATSIEELIARFDSIKMDL